MAIQFTNFLGHGEKTPDYSPISNLLGNILQGYQTAKAPAQMERKAEQEELANALARMNVEHKPQEMQLSDALKRAQVKYYGQRGLGGGSTFTGAMKNWINAHPNATPEEIRQKQEELESVDLERKRTGTQRMQSLTDTQSQRSASPVTKIYGELEKINEGIHPATGKPLSPDMQNHMRSSLMLDVIKKTTDPKARNQLINAQNMNITLDSIDPKALTTYSGIKNKGDKIGDSIAEGLGEGSERYRKYVAEAQKASAAAKQMRMYLGDSIQPTAQERLDKLTNPESWNVSPETAQKNFEFMRDLFKRESQTLIRAMTDPSLYTNIGNIGDQSTNQSNQIFNLATGQWE